MVKLSNVAHLKICSVLVALALALQSHSQNLQLHYDFRHTLDPAHNASNFPTVYFEYFKSQDSGRAFIKPGSFLIKMQADFLGQRNNMGKFFMQVAQSFRFWKPKVFLVAQFSSGMGVTEPKQYSYYISNAYSFGISYPFQWKGGWFNSMLTYTYNALAKPSHDFLYSFYWGKGFWNYKFEFIGDFEVYSLNKNQGDELTKNLEGKWICFFGEPQFWYNLNKHLALGSKINLYYHVLNFDDHFQVYPTIALKYKL
ncbi:MAG: hypothetical protein C5B59_02275 [Bacteroidetes bacterium]|nr:MAG: hypothetical protein C5B59_02275 [Bacteroidota bacterium]